MEKEIKLPSKNEIPNVVPNCWGRVFVKSSSKKNTKNSKAGIFIEEMTAFFEFLKKI